MPHNLETKANRQQHKVTYFWRRKLKKDWDSHARHCLAVCRGLRHGAELWKDDWLELPPGYLRHLHTAT